MSDGPRFRSFLVHGWAFRTDLSEAEVQAVKAYLDDGDHTKLPLRYQRLRTKVRQEPSIKKML